jgi:site-specific recombinase XerD
VVTCLACGQERPLRGRERCSDCFQHDPTRVTEAADRLAARREQTPGWWTGFAGYLAARLCPDRAIGLLHQLDAVLPAGQPGPALALPAARSAREGTALARALQAYFIQTRLMLPADLAERAAASRRAQRVAEVPTPFRAAVASFNDSQLQARDRARRAGTKPRSNPTLEIHLAGVRDLARFLTTTRPAVTGWQLVNRDDVEAFLATAHNPASRARHLNSLRMFFRWARTHRLLLSDPTRGLHANSNFGFHGRVLEITQQRELLRRWSIHADQLPPNEPLVGLLGLLHGASVTELRRAQATDVHLTEATIQLGRRPSPTPLDPLTTAALRRALAHRHGPTDGNPHLLVNQTTKTIAGPVSAVYLQRLLAPAGVTVQLLRATRLADMVTSLDPIIVAHAFGIHYGAALHYLADTVDSTRLANL